MIAPFNRQGYRILNISGDMAKVSAQFMYRGFMISFSTIFHPSPCTVVIFMNDKEMADCETVEAAINWCDNYHTKASA